MFEPRVAVASLSGQSDAAWATRAAPQVGAAFLGGIALDEPTRRGARRLVERDREEFLPEDPVDWIERQLDALSGVPIRAAVNVRSTTTRPLSRAARCCARKNAIVEINAHCRQDELCAVGAGQTLLAEPDRLVELVGAAATAGATVSVKCRTEVEGVDLPAVAARCEAAGADLIHVDAMDSESVIADVVDATDAFVVANNEVRDRASVAEYLEYGADAVSVGRPSTEPAVLERVGNATAAWFRTQRTVP